jgi:hypothetical protein
MRASLDALQRAVIPTGDPTRHADMRKITDWKNAQRFFRLPTLHEAAS